MGEWIDAVLEKKLVTGTFATIESSINRVSMASTDDAKKHKENYLFISVLLLSHPNSPIHLFLEILPALPSSQGLVRLLLRNKTNRSI